MWPSWKRGHLARVGIILWLFMATLQHTTDCFLYTRQRAKDGELDFTNYVLRRRNNVLTRRQDIDRRSWAQMLSKRGGTLSSSKVNSLDFLLDKIEISALDTADRRSEMSEELIGPQTSKLVRQQTKMLVRQLQRTSKVARCLQQTLKVMGRSQQSKLIGQLQQASELIDQFQKTTVMTAENNQVRKKRSFDFDDAADVVCPFVNTWGKLTQAYDINNNLVRVYQPSATDPDRHQKYQYFNTVSCIANSRAPADCPTCCTGINSSYTSTCETKLLYVQAKVHLPIPNTVNTFEEDAVWRNISINAGCQCSIERTTDDT